MNSATLIRCEGIPELTYIPHIHTHITPGSVCASVYSVCACIFSDNCVALYDRV